MTLFEALQKLLDFDEQDEIDLTAHLEAITATREKVDKYKFVIDQLELQAGFWKEKAREASKRASRLETTVESIKERLIAAMKLYESPELVGYEYKVKLYTHPKVEIKREPITNDLLTHDLFLRSKLEWDKKKILEALKADSTNIDDFAQLVSSTSIRFSHARTSQSPRKSSPELQTDHQE
jgi:hypothetical protein